MTEDEMKKKRCPHLSFGAMMLAIELGKNGSPIKEITTTLDDAALCSGSECAMWEPEYEEESMTISEKDETPEGWHERRDGKECSKHKYVGVIGKSRLVFKQAESNKGDCGLKTKESGCFYP